MLQARVRVKQCLNVSRLYIYVYNKKTLVIGKVVGWIIGGLDLVWECLWECRSRLRGSSFLADYSGHEMRALLVEILRSQPYVDFV